MTPRPLKLLLLMMPVLLLGAWPARADFGPIEMASGGAVQPADKAEAPALSANGQMLAFQASIGGLDGVFVRNLQTGALGHVAVTDAYGEVALKRATAPSISADGRFVAFTTRARLDPDNDPGASSPDVYVADLTYSPPRYELASARDGCDPAVSTGCGLSYASGGSEASGRVALSATGSKVVFYTTGASDLGGSPGDTPAGQVVLRDLATDTTTLVSVERDPETGAMTGDPVAGGALLLGEAANRLRGAALSADGTTVSWLGTHLPAQLPLLPAEAETFTELDLGLLPYDEPLWRRLADGPNAPTRRVVGGPDGPFAFPSLTAKEASELNSFQGWLGLNAVNGVPRLSADGRTVALIGNPAEATDLFLVDMSPGLSRAEAIRQLTRAIVVDPLNPKGTINASAFLALTGHIFDLALSADGRRIVFASYRQQYPLAPPNLISQPPSTGRGMVELYEIDLDSEALERVTHGTGGLGEASTNPEREPAPTQGDGASAPSIAGDLLAFASTASNLVAEDSNEASDVFTVEAREAARLPSEPTIRPGPGPINPRRPWRLTLNAFSLPNGKVKLLAGVPGPGRLSVRVGPQGDSEVRAQRLTNGGRKVRRAGQVALELALPRRLRGHARSGPGVHGIARVSFRRQGRKVLRGKLQVRFRVHAKKRGKP